MTVITYEINGAKICTLPSTPLISKSKVTGLLLIHYYKFWVHVDITVGSVPLSLYTYLVQSYFPSLFNFFVILDWRIPSEFTVVILFTSLPFVFVTTSALSPYSGVVLVVFVKKSSKDLDFVL